MSPRRCRPVVALAVAFACAAAILAPAAARADLRLPRISPDATVSQTVGITDLAVTYSRPGVKGRVIWGGLVPYGTTWRTGANDATTFTTSDDITVAGQALPAGKYSLFTIPTAGDWTVVFSRQHDLWGAFAYDSTMDQLRVTVAPAAAVEPVEWMRFTFENLTPTSADLVLRWEKLALALPIAVDVPAIVLRDARAAVDAAAADDWRTPYRAAQYCFDNGVGLDDGAAWLGRSLGIQKAYANTALSARWLDKDGRRKEAIAAAREALAIAKASPENENTTATETLLAEWTGKKK